LELAGRRGLSLHASAVPLAFKQNFVTEIKKYGVMTMKHRHGWGFLRGRERIAQFIPAV
jgi:hypothetical protein